MGVTSRRLGRGRRVRLGVDVTGGFPVGPSQLGEVPQLKVPASLKAALFVWLCLWYLLSPRTVLLGMDKVLEICTTIGTSLSTPV